MDWKRTVHNASMVIRSMLSEYGQICFSPFLTLLIITMPQARRPIQILFPNCRRNLFLQNLYRWRPKYRRSFRRNHSLSLLRKMRRNPNLTKLLSRNPNLTKLLSRKPNLSLMLNRSLNRFQSLNPNLKNERYHLSWSPNCLPKTMCWAAVR